MNQKVEPFPGLDSTQMRPLWSSTASLHMARPSPVPLRPRRSARRSSCAAWTGGGPDAINRERRVIETEMTAPSRSRYDQQMEAGLTAIRRWGKPEEVARVEASYTGRVLADVLPAQAGRAVAS